MNKRVLRRLCVTLGLPLSTIGASAQQQSLISAQMMSRAQEDIMRMSETELRSFVAVLVDCSPAQMIMQQPQGAVCASTHEKYTIEYQRDRPVDTVLTMLLTTSFVHLGEVSIELGKGTPQVDDIARAMREGQRRDGGALKDASEAQLALRRAATEPFRRKRAQ